MESKEKVKIKDGTVTVMGIPLEGYHIELLRHGYDPQSVAIHAAQENIL